MENKDHQTTFYTKSYSSLYKNLTLEKIKNQNLNSRIIKIAEKILPGENILDIGCGSGSLFYHVKDKFEKFYGIDISPDSISAIKNWNNIVGLNIELNNQNIDSSKLNFRESSFDTIVCIAILEFIFNPENLLIEIHSLLKENGMLFIQIGNIAYIRNRIRLLFGMQPYTSKFKGELNGGALHFYNLNEIKRSLNNNGYIINNIFCSGKFSGIRNLWPSLLGSDLIISCIKK